MTRTRRPRIARITFSEWAGLISGRIARVYHERASVEITGRGEAACFLMQGPSGAHTLAVPVTDVTRLNAHWKVFAADTRNQYAA